MKKNQLKKLKLAKETLRGLEQLVHGGTDPSLPQCQTGNPSSPYCGTVGGGGGGDTSAGFYADPEAGCKG